MCEHHYSILLHFQSLYQGNSYMFVDRKERSEADRQFLQQLYEFLAFKIRFQTEIKKVALKAIYEHTLEAVHSFYGTNNEPSIKLIVSKDKS